VPYVLAQFVLDFIFQRAGSPCLRFCFAEIWGGRSFRCAPVRNPHNCDVHIGPGPQTIVLRVKAGEHAIYPGPQIRSGDPPLTTTATTHADIEANYKRLGH